MAYTPPPLSRSISSSTLWHYCQKKYYFQYYTNRLRSISTDLWLQALLYKNLSSYKMWIGTHTHNILGDYLRLLQAETTAASDLDRLHQLTRDAMTQEFGLSLAKDYTSYDRDQKFGLNEHALTTALPDDALDHAIDTVIGNLEAFSHSQIHDDLSRYMRDGHRVYIEDKKPNFDKMKMIIDYLPTLQGVTIRAQPDAGVITQDGRFIIYDWKSGRIKEERQTTPLSQQLKVYALKVLTKTQKTIADTHIEGYEVYVPSMETFGGVINTDHIATIEQQLVDDVRMLSSMLEDHDVVRNQPLAVEQFARTDNMNKCASCRFQHLCEQLKTLEKPSLF